MRLVYSQDAVADLVRLREFVSAHDPAAARRIAADLTARIEQLCAFPAMGKAVPLAPQPGSVRDFVFGPYIVRYAHRESALMILRVWHQLEPRGP